jgi:hypothetical protein
MKKKLLLIFFLLLAISAGWTLGRLSMKQHMALTMFIDQTTNLSYLEQNKTSAAANMMRIWADATVLELTSKEARVFSSITGNSSHEWLMRYAVLRSKMPPLPTDLYDKEHDIKVTEALNKVKK